MDGNQKNGEVTPKGMEQGKIYHWHPIYNPDVTEEVTKTGRSLLDKMVQTAKEQGFEILVVEDIDTLSVSQLKETLEKFDGLKIQ